MTWRVVWKITKGIGKVLLAGVLVTLLLPFVMTGLFGGLWNGPR